MVPACAVPVAGGAEPKTPDGVSWVVLLLLPPQAASTVAPATARAATLKPVRANALILPPARPWRGRPASAPVPARRLGQRSRPQPCMVDSSLAAFPIRTRRQRAFGPAQGCRRGKVISTRRLEPVLGRNQHVKLLQVV